MRTQKNRSFDTWRKVLRYALPYRRSLSVLFVIMLATAFIDMVLPLLTMYMVDHYITPGNIDEIWKFALVYFVALLVLSTMIWTFVRLGGKLETHICYDIRKAGFARLQQLSFGYFDRTPVGWLMARMTSDCKRLGFILSWGFVDILWGMMLMSGICLVMLWLHWQLALIVLTTLPLLLWVSGKFQKLILRSYRDVRRNNSRITGAFNEGIAGVQTTKTLVRERENLGEFQQLTNEMFRSSFSAALQSSLYLPLVQIIGAAGCGLALYFGGSGVIAGTVTYGTLVAFISYSRFLFDPIHQIARIFAEFQNAQAAAERVIHMIETTPEICDDPRQVEISNENRRIRGAIEFRNVVFCYQKGEPVLANFNLQIEPGQTIALVGETGSGKSTIVNLVCRFYQPTQGSILIDGFDYRKYSLDWLHRNLGIVLQQPTLFSGSIADNIRYGRLDASDTEVEEAARLAHAHDFIVAMDKGYDSEVGEGGELLSTGQKQLVSLARAVVTNPRIFVMDEATAAVDAQTEMRIQQAIAKILAGRTCFIIAHRLSTIRAADRILVIDKGKIIEEGNHHQLLKQRGHYYQLYTNHFYREAVS